ncbi:MAG: hypothetical protein JSS49_22990 [Planctomycetes bacterium]|nr:hypothetical protein [Planctomycetota bacterium]
MPAASVTALLCCLMLTGLLQSSGLAQTVIDSDFSKGDFARLGWKVQGDWSVYKYPNDVKNNPGLLARFAANKPDGSLTYSFDEVRDVRGLELSLEYGWGWGDAAQGADGVSFMLLNGEGSGYFFRFHRVKANWAVQRATVADHKVPPETIWAPLEIDGTHAAVRDGGGLIRVKISRDASGNWMISSRDWNHGAGEAVFFNDVSTTSFNQLVLLGTQNFDDQLFNRIKLTFPSSEAATATPVSEFLDSIGIVTTFPDRGQPVSKTVEMVNYCRFRWIRGGIEGLSESGPTTIETYLELHRKTGAKFSWGLVSGGTDLNKLLDSARKIAAEGALLAFEGNNEPNNWGVTYQGEQGGGQAASWRAVAKLQRDLYAAVKRDPQLMNYPVWSISEGGGQKDNMGLQFLKIPAGAETDMPDGTAYADFANVHNYIYHPSSPGLEDNKTWNAADPTSACKVDGLYGNYGTTWAKHFRGYSQLDLLHLPRVTTETGCTIGGPVTEEIQARNILSLYLDQFKRGWQYTSVYLLRDRADEGGNQTFGLFKPDYSPRKAAVYLHNLTTILADQKTIEKPGRLKYTIAKQPITTHDMLLQKSDGTFELVVWGERLEGSDEITIQFDHPLTSVTIYDPTSDTRPTSKQMGIDKLIVTLSDHPLVIEIVSNK